MMEGIKEFLMRHATHQSLYVKIFFANQGNMRKNIIQEPLPPKNITTYFPELTMAEFLLARLSTPLTDSKSNGVLSPFRLSITLEEEDRKLKFRIFRKNLEASSVIRSLKRSNSADGTRQESSCTRRKRGEGLAPASRTAWAISCRIRSYTPCSLSRTGATPGSTSCARGLEALRRGRGCRSYRRHR